MLTIKYIGEKVCQGWGGYSGGRCSCSRWGAASRLPIGSVRTRIMPHKKNVVLNLRGLCL